ncbi:MAG: hypothetical protein AB7L92_00705 [Alphaproteobacteria bacterium]
MKLPLLSATLFSLASILSTSVSAQTAVPVARAPLITSAQIDCDLSGGPIVYFVNTSLRFEGTLISQDPTVWFVPDHQYCLTIRAPAYCNMLRFFNGQTVNGQRIVLPADVRVRSVVLGGTPNISNFVCQ